MRVFTADRRVFEFHCNILFRHLTANRAKQSKVRAQCIQFTYAKDSAATEAWVDVMAYRHSRKSGLLLNQSYCFRCKGGSFECDEVNSVRELAHVDCDSFRMASWFNIQQASRCITYLHVLVSEYGIDACQAGGGIGCAEWPVGIYACFLNSCDCRRNRVAQTGSFGRAHTVLSGSGCGKRIASHLWGKA